MTPAKLKTALAAAGPSFAELEAYYRLLPDTACDCITPGKGHPGEVRRGQGYRPPATPRAPGESLKPGPAGAGVFRLPFLPLNLAVENLKSLVIIHS